MVSTKEQARTLRAKVLRWTGIPVCIGMAPTKLLAKAANRYAKKNKAVTGGVFDITGREEEILSRMETGDLWGVGKKLSLRLKSMGITTALELKQADPAAIRKSMGVIGERMLRELNGIACLELEEMPPDRKGVMASRSVRNPCGGLRGAGRGPCQPCGSSGGEDPSLSASSPPGMEVFIKTNRFRKEDPQYSRGIAITLDRPTNGTAELMTKAHDLLHQIYRPGDRYKKTGVQLANLVSEEEYQPELFDRPSSTIRVDKIVDGDATADWGTPRTL